MSNLVDYAKEELKKIGMIDSGEPYNDSVTKAILDLIEMFASQNAQTQAQLWIYNMIFNRDKIIEKTEQWTKEAEKAGMTLTEYLESINPLNKSEFHCGVEESGFHAYNCNDCPNKCEEWYQWDKEMKENG